MYIYTYVSMNIYILCIWIYAYIFIHAREDLGRQEPDLQPVAAGFGISIYRYR